MGGILLFLSQYNLGVIQWSETRQRVSELIGSNDMVDTLFMVILAIAALGGIAVVIGGLLLGIGRRAMGKTIVLIGVGFGLIGLLFYLMTGAAAGNLFLGGASLTLTVGLILAIAARMVAGRSFARRVRRPMRW